MRFDRVGERRYARFERLAQAPGLVHAFSTRGQDVAPRGGCGAEQRAGNRAAMAADWGLEPARLLHCHQVHKPTLAIVRSLRPAAALADTDSVICSVPGQPVMCFSADCPLVLVYEPAARVLGVAHASWRCTVARITSRLVHAMVEYFGARADRMLAGIGPSAGPQRYEVGPEVYEAAAHLPGHDALFPRVDRRTCFDLWRANVAQLTAAGVPEHNIEVAGICTISDGELFYSYRREGAGCGHFGLIAALTDQPSMAQ